MQQLLRPIRTESLKDAFVKRFEELILSGALPIGQKLPSERELALQLNVSRPVVHEGLVDLAAKGLVSLVPRVGTVVSDYRREGSLSLLTSLLNYHQGDLKEELFTSLLEMRFLFEVETARRAANHRTEHQLEAFGQLLRQEASVNHHNTDRVSELDFGFHHLIAMASGNDIYPLLLNSFKSCYLNLAFRFFSDTTVVPEVFAFHNEMVIVLKAKDEERAVEIMKNMLAHGAEHLKSAQGSRLKAEM